MKLLTLNTHSLIEPYAENQVEPLTSWILEQGINIACFQEVNQKQSDSLVDQSSLIASGYVPPEAGSTIPIKQSNFVLAVARALRNKGRSYYWTWLPVHVGYNTYDEGLAVLSSSPISDVHSIHLSKSQDYSDYRTRKALGIQTEGQWFYSVHFNWWKDGFAAEWYQLERQLSQIKLPIYLLGDFNNPDNVEHEGYSLMIQSGWYDSYVLAEQKDDGYTIGGMIDGWRDKLASSMRIDYILLNSPIAVKSAKVVFKGKSEPILSDHFGIYVEL